jgi:fructose-bisphosphate aldolase class II
MTLSPMAPLLRAANEGGYALAGLVCLGWEDARAYAMAAQEAALPVILQVGPGARAHMPLDVWGPMLRRLAADVDVPVAVHLDHGRTIDEARAAIDAGFTSVMVDGSALPYAENVALTADVARLARAAGISCEGEIGVVGYADGAPSEGSDPDEAARFAAEAGVDALAVSVGNVHLQIGAGRELDERRLAAIAAATDVPLVIHGGSGVPPAQRARLARTTSVAKFNIGTELRQVFGAALRETLAADPDLFDRIAILRGTEDRLHRAARNTMRELA